MTTQPIYLDYNATTPIDRRVAEAMMPYLYEHFGNPSSTHPYGVQARRAVERARAQVAALLGERFVRLPPEFEEAQARLGEHIAHFGYAEDMADYARWLWQADIVVSTAIHEFFGAAVVEALYCDCFPVLPHRLSFPDYVPAEYHARCLYRNFDGLVARLRAAILHIEQTRRISFRRRVARYDWPETATLYDADLESVRLTRPAARR